MLDESPGIGRKVQVVELRDGIGSLSLHNLIAQQFSMTEGVWRRVAGAIKGLINLLPLELDGLQFSVLRAWGGAT